MEDKMKKYRVIRTWYVEAESAIHAAETATSGSNDEIEVKELKEIAYENIKSRL
jgi:hypothetical protein